MSVVSGLKQTCCASLCLCVKTSNVTHLNASGSVSIEAWVVSGSSGIDEFTPGSYWGCWPGSLASLPQALFLVTWASPQATRGSLLQCMCYRKKSPEHQDRQHSICGFLQLSLVLPSPCKTHASAEEALACRCLLRDTAPPVHMLGHVRVFIGFIHIYTCPHIDVPVLMLCVAGDCGEYLWSSVGCHQTRNLLWNQRAAGSPIAEDFQSHKVCYLCSPGWGNWKLGYMGMAGIWNLILWLTGLNIILVVKQHIQGLSWQEPLGLTVSLGLSLLATVLSSFSWFSL